MALSGRTALPAQLSAHSPILPSCRKSIVLRCASKGGEGPPKQQIVDITVFAARSLCGLSAVLAAAAATAGPASARGAEWQPRRHHRRLEPEAWREKSQVETPRQAQRPREAPSKARKSGTGLQSQLADLQVAVGSSLSSGWREVTHEARHVRRRVQQAVGGGAIRERRAVQGVAPGPAPAPQGLLLARDALGAAALIAAAGFACWFLLTRLWEWLNGPQARGGGRVVRDRSMGGKAVFIPNQPLRRVEARPLSLWSPDEDSGKLASARSSLVAAAAPTSTAAAIPEEVQWWDEPKSPAYVHPRQKEQAQAQAKAIVKVLEDCKISGRDYPLELLADLRTACSSAGTSVRTSTESGRDAMFRTAVAAALQMAQDGTSGLIAGCTPPQFVCGLAADLGIPKAKAENIVHGQVATQARGLIITACAGTRSNDRQQNLVSLLGMAGILEKFPLPRGSAAGELVASGIQQRCSLPERESVFLTYGAMAPESAALAAELLGFDPELVVPQLSVRAKSG